MWTGVFVGGAILSTSLSAAGGVLTKLFPGIRQETVEQVVLFHALVAGYVAVGPVLWILRPIFRRMHHIVREIANLQPNTPLQPSGDG